MTKVDQIEDDDFFYSAQDSVSKIDEEMAVEIGTFELLKYPRFLFAALSGVLGYFLYDF